MATTNELLVQVTFLETLQRSPTPEELSIYTQGTWLDGGVVSQSTLKAYLETTVEYQKLQGTYAGSMSYNPVTWTMTTTDVYAPSYHGLLLSNGKVAMHSKGSHFPIDKTYVTTKFDFDEVGKYTNNVVRGIEYATFKWFRYDQQGIDVSGLTHSLDMKTAIMKNKYQVVSADATLQVEHDLMALRQYPFCTMQSITVTSPVTRDVTFWHQLQSEEPLDNLTYTNNYIHDTYFFSANAVIERFESNFASLENTRLSLSNIYLFEDASGARGSNRGYNILRNDVRTAYNEFVIPLEAGVPFTFHLISCMMTNHDFPQPQIESERILLNLRQKSPATIRAEHVSVWGKQWVDSVEVNAKDGSGMTVEATAAVDEVQRQINYALYNIYSAVRDDVSLDSNPLNLSILDIHGHLFWSAELWLVPVLLFLKPKAARVLIDFRYAMLENAKRLARAHGFEGTKYPYENDVIGYSTVYWDTVSPMYVYNTGLISISAWNYFRVTQDEDWLFRRGYEILKNNADFFVSISEYDSLTNTTHIPTVYGIAGVLANDNSVTNYLAKHALKYAIEATYKLNYRVPPRWQQMYDTLSWEMLPIDISGNANIIRLDSVDPSGAEPFSSLRSVPITEPLLMLHPYYSKMFYCCKPEFNKNTYYGNLDHWDKRLSTETENHYWNTLMEATLLATAAQMETEYSVKQERMNSYLAAIGNLMEYSTLEPWKNFYNPFSALDTITNQSNDLSISAMYILNLLTGIGGLRIRGGINSARYVYEPFGVISRSAYVMPETWREIVLNGVGTQEESIKITNSLYVVGYC